MSSSVTENKSLHIAASCWTFIDIKKSCVVEIANIHFVNRSSFKVDTIYKPALGVGGLSLSLKKMGIGLITCKNRRMSQKNKIKSTVFYVNTCTVLLLLCRVIKNDCRGFNNLSYTIDLR